MVDATERDTRHTEISTRCDVRRGLMLTDALAHSLLGNACNQKDNA